MWKSCRNFSANFVKICLKKCMLQNPSGSNTLQRCMNPGLCLASRGDPVGAPRYGGYRVPASTRAWLGDTRRATSSRKKFFSNFLANVRSFSAVSAPIFESKYALLSIFKNYTIIKLNFQKVCKQCNSVAEISRKLLIFATDFLLKCLSLERWVAAWWFRLRGRELRPEDACQKRFSWFSDWSPKVQKCAHLVELEKCCQTNVYFQNFVLIQQRTSPPKICKKLLIPPTPDHISRRAMLSSPLLGESRRASTSLPPYYWFLSGSWNRWKTSPLVTKSKQMNLVLDYFFRTQKFGGSPLVKR